LQVERVLLIAPPVGNLPVPEPDARFPTDVFAGDADAFVDQSALAAWQHAQVHLLPGADHFFGGRWQELEQAIGGTLEG
jgi:alpha/beta superfamily hydrolase